ncbi:MAG: hypothetical protein HRF43_08125 [Phycisphaerae bacterium]|jgi:hypothetical protein
MKARLRLLAETLFLTVLIWTYADQASHESCESVIAVRIITPPDVVARIDGARAGGADVLYIPVKLRGPKAAVRKLEVEKSTGITPAFTLNVPVTDDLELHRPHTRDLRDQAARLPAIRDHGLQLVELARPDVTFTLDRYVTMNLTVEADAGRFSEALNGKPVIVPKQVSARVLESELAKRANAEPRLVLTIENQLRSRSSEAEMSFTVALGTKWEGLDVTFQPDQVRVTVRLDTVDDQARLTLIPLRVLMPPGIIGTDYEIEWKTDADLLQDIDVRIPIGKPRALANTDVIALLQIEKSDLPAERLLPSTTAPAPSEAWSQREIRFVFPPEFEDVQVVGPPRLVQFRIKKKAVGGELTPP